MLDQRSETLLLLAKKRQTLQEKWQCERMHRDSNPPKGLIFYARKKLNCRMENRVGGRKSGRRKEVVMGSQDPARKNTTSGY